MLLTKQVGASRVENRFINLYPGVLVGDTVVALENNPLSNFDSFFTFMQVIGRPVTIT